MAITERPYKYCFSKNEIRYVFNVPDVADRPGLFLEVKLKYAAIGEISFTDLYTWQLKPQDDGTTYIYLQGYLDSLVNYVLPNSGAMFTDANDQLRQFYIEWREVEDANPNPDWDAGEATNIRTVIKGGIERHKQSRNNYFVNHLDTLKPFLTWQPANRFIYSTDPFFVSFLNKNGAVEKTGSKVKIDFTYIDGTTSTHTSTVTTDALMVHCYPLFDTPIDVDASPKIWYLDVSIVEGDGTTVIINPYRVYVEYRPAYTYYNFVCHNSLGGIDWLRIAGDTEISYTRTTAEGEGGLDVNDWTSIIKPHEKMYSNILLQRNYKGDIGFLHTKQRQEAFLEFLVSKSIYMGFDGRWVPVLNLKSSQTLRVPTPNAQPASFPVEWQLSESNEVFTPKTAEFGVGTDTEIY